MTQRPGRGRGFARGLSEYFEIPPELAEAAGEPAIAAMATMKQGVDAGGGDLRQRHLAQAQAHMTDLDPRRHGHLLHYLQARVLELGGRNNTRLAHVTPGEVVAPDELMTPEVVNLLRRAAKDKGIDPERFVVGNRRNSINPRTGQPEFDDPLDSWAPNDDLNYNLSNLVDGSGGQDPTAPLPRLGNLPDPSRLGGLLGHLPSDFPSILGNQGGTASPASLGHLPDLPGELPPNFPSLLGNAGEPTPSAPNQDNQGIENLDVYANHPKRNSSPYRYEIGPTIPDAGPLPKDALPYPFRGTDPRKPPVMLVPVPHPTPGVPKPIPPGPPLPWADSNWKWLWPA